MGGLALICACAAHSFAAASKATFVVPDATPGALRLYAESLLNWPIYAATGFAIPLVALYSRFAALLGRVCLRIARREWLAAMLFVVAYEVLATLIAMPVHWLRGLELMRQFGLYRGTTAHWIGEMLWRSAIDALMTAPLFGVGLWLIHRFPRKWWLFLVAIYVPYSLGIQLFDAHVVNPLFTKTVPLEDGRLKQRIDALAKANGAGETAIVMENVSDKMKEANAYVTGVGPALKIALTDDLIHGYTEDEVLFVVAHELGHYRMHHVWIGWAEDAVLAAIYVGLFAWIGPVLIQRNGGAWRIRSISEPAAIPVALLMFALLPILTDPPIYAIQRYQEAQADRFAVITTGNPDACAGFWVTKIHDDFDVPDPDPVEHWMRDDHPTVSERLADCRSVPEGRRAHDP